MSFICPLCPFDLSQTLTQLLSRANLARSTALQAVSAGNATFYEVEQILKSLRGNILETLPVPSLVGSHRSSEALFPCVFLSEFNLQADDKRREAEDAMRRLPIISSMVASAREKTDRAEAILGSAASESKAASSMAGEAKEITVGIQQVRASPGAIAGRKGFARENHRRTGDGWQLQWVCMVDLMRGLLDLMR